MIEKLIELLESAESAVYWNSSDKGFIEKIADHLIANGVTIPVRCKDCKYYEMHYGRGNMGCSNNKAIWTQCPPDAFCSYGERKDNGTV